MIGQVSGGCRLAYVLIHAAIAFALMVSIQRSLARGFILGEDDDEIRVGSFGFGLQMVVEAGGAAYCTVMAVRALLCL